MTPGLQPTNRYGRLTDPRLGWRRRVQSDIVSISKLEVAVTDFLIRDVDENLMRQLKDRAQRNGRSLQQEVHEALQRGAEAASDDVSRIFEEFDAKHPVLPSGIDVVEVLREERENYGWK
jgi:plasmid stability protein